VEEWVRALTDVPVRRVPPDGPFDPPGEREITVGGPEAVKDQGPVGLDLVGILDADLAARRPGLSAMERALAVWMEAAGWARPAGRVIVQASRPSDPAVQALVTGNPERFYRVEIARREQAGFPPGHPVFRVTGGPDLESELRRLSPETLLASAGGEETVCLVTVRPEDMEPFGRAVRALAAGGTVSRVEAEPHL
jgi:primosomal protein N' (replication factor Y)